MIEELCNHAMKASIPIPNVMTSWSVVVKIFEAKVLELGQTATCDVIWGRENGL